MLQKTFAVLILFSIAAFGQTSFRAAFDGGHSPANPGPPAAWNPPDWDIQVHVRSAHEKLGALDPHDADHGPNCEAPGHDGSVTHSVDAIEEAVYQCADHVMTSLRADDYGLAALTPSAMADFSQGEAVIRFDVSSLSVSQRDWFGVVIQPWDDQLPLPIVDWLPDLNGFGRSAIHLDFGGGVICPVVYRDFAAAEGADKFSSGCRWWESWESALTPSAQTRTTIQITLSRTRVRVEVPSIGLVWADMTIEDLGWDKGVVSFLHHSYTPFKDGNGGPNTWHWDNVEIAPSQPFSILKADRRWVNQNGATLAFADAAPPDSHLRASAIGTVPELSFDGGQTWETARQQPSQKEGPAWQIWHAVPQGARSVLVRSSGPNPGWWPSGWIFKDAAIFSLEAGATTPPPPPPADKECRAVTRIFEKLDGRWVAVDRRDELYAAPDCTAR